ncbi:Sec34-like family-domain-containing protein [Papiliotrema laurentii]|uniref:Conserved oligomeric Golgi complex subunit 3 n=1 Tax=Papiliotrema laurentii TaxID=5418 RepID=A0AAD9FW08_PAPLA|nr:Sec34-like family-domain-containing protein [Papiliotrema laurentii]
MSRPQTPSYAVRRPPLNAALNTAVGSGISRGGSPSKPVITLDEWEFKAPLTDTQLQSIAVVKDKLGQRPLPKKFRTSEAESSAQGAASSVPSTPTAPRPARLAHLLHSPSPRPKSPSVTGSPAPGASHLFASDPLHPVIINTPQQFHEHFAALTLSTEHEQDSLYRDHLAEIIGLREKCDGLIEILKDGEGEVSEMLKALEYVEERSESLRGACEDLLEEQTHLLTHTSQLAHRLTFFTFLETAQRMLNSHKVDLVLQEDFLPMVKRLDECLGYLGGHRDFKDAEVYLLRYQQCMTRSMTLIKIFFVNTVKALGQEVARRIADRALSETATQALIYTKFASLASSLRPLIAELENRVKISPNELSSLLAECHSVWVATRQSLIGGRVTDEVARMNPHSSDLVDLTRTGCSYLKQTCIDEFNLYKHFFLSGETTLYGFLESLCDKLYDHLRPRILHEPSLEVLCGVCTVLQALMVQDVNIDEDPDEAIYYSPNSTPGSPAGNGPEDYFSLADETFSARQRRTGSVRGYSGSVYGRRDAPKRHRKPLDRLHTEVLLRMVLQDAQTRLVFRAQALLRADVEYYVPKDGDLDYPDKIKGQSGKLVQRQMNVSLDPDDDDEPAFLSLPSTVVQETWYPPLRVTLWVLSCLYTYVDAAVFDDLAQEAVITARKNLGAASDLISAKKDKNVDAKLFLVRHLLILKEMTAGLDLGRKDRKKEWQGITDFLRSLLDNASYMLGYGRGPIPKTSDVALDAKTDVDRHLKIACEELIRLCTQSATAPLAAFLDQCTAYLSSRPASAADLSAQSFATPEKVSEVHAAFKAHVREQVDRWVESLTVYLQDEDTVNVLVPPAHGAIVDAYRQFHDLIRAEYDFSTAASILTPAGVQNLLTSKP